MNPETAKKLAQMGDVKGNAQKLKVAIEKAKANPDHPDSVELRRRLERGMFNVELQSLGKKPFPVQQPKIDLGAAMAAAKPQMVEGVQTGVNDKPKAESSLLADAAGGLVYGLSAPGRTIQEQVGKVLPSAMFGVDKNNRRGQFEEATGGRVNLESPVAKTTEFVGEMAPMVVGGNAVAGAVKGAPALVQGLARGAGSFATQSLNEGEVNQSSYVAGAVDAAIPLAKPILALGGGILKGLAGSFSGAGAEAVEAAIERPGAAWKAVGFGADELKGLAQKVRSGASNLYKKAGTEYAETVAKAGIEEIPKDDFITGVSQKVASLADADLADDGLKLVDTPFTDIEERQLQKMYNVIKNWTDYTPQGVNTLATKVSKFRRGAADTANFDRVVDGTRRYIRDYVGEKYPVIADAVKKYADKMDMLGEIDNVLKTSPELGTREGIRKTSEALGRIFNANKDISREAIEELEKDLGVDIIGTVAGMQLSNVGPRSSARIGDAVMNLVQPVAGVATRNLAPLTGAVQQQVVDRIMAIPGVPETARAALVKSLADLFSEPDQSVPTGTEEETR